MNRAQGSMKILCVLPPQIPSYFNAGHHLPVFMVGSYLRKVLPQSHVRCVDAAALNLTWKEMCALLMEEYDLIALMNDFDGVDTFERFLHYKNALCPQAKVITFGRLSQQIPRFFFQFPIDAVACSGDYEATVVAYARWLLGFVETVPGVMHSRQDSPLPGVFLPAEEWVLPDVTEIPYTAYSYMYRDDLNKFCGIPDRQELVVPTARGCPIGCSYCDVPEMQGKTERRLSVERTVGYIVDSFERLPFEYVSFYAPTFTLDHKWMAQFGEALRSLPRRYPWKCVTVLRRLNEALIEDMARSGCVRISVGIETFSKPAARSLPKCKQDVVSEFEHIASICRDKGVELNCFVILGLPGDSPETIQFTIELCRKYGARVRPTIYTPYHLLREDMTVGEVTSFNRQLFPRDVVTKQSAQQYYAIFHGRRDDRETRVMEKIATAGQSTPLVIAGALS